MRAVLMLTICVSALLAAAAGAAAEEKPAATPVSWELKFEFQQPQRIIATARGGRSGTYWYVLYRVINTTGDDRDFLPVIDRISEIESELPDDQVAKSPDLAPRILRSPARIGLDPAVFQAIKQRHKTTHPFLVPPVESIGRIKQGADNAIDSVAIFDDLDPRISSFTVYVGGLTGERKQLANPTYDPKKPRDEKNTPFFVIQKTLAIPYKMPGDANTRRAVEPRLERLYWVMR